MDMEDPFVNLTSYTSADFEHILLLMDIPFCVHCELWYYAEMWQSVNMFCNSNFHSLERNFVLLTLIRFLTSSWVEHSIGVIRAEYPAGCFEDFSPHLYSGMFYYVPPPIPLVVVGQSRAKNRAPHGQCIQAYHDLYTGISIIWMSIWCLSCLDNYIILF